MEKPIQNKSMIPGAIIIAGAFIAVAIIFKYPESKRFINPDNQGIEQNITRTEAVIFDGGHILSLEAEKSMLDKLQKDGVIDASKLAQVTELNLLWAFGLANKNQILDNGPIEDLRYGGPMNMASVGGWTASSGSPSDHMSKHGYVTLTTDEQVLVEKMSKGIYRPCCDNSTYFPDCNHGMAMLGLLEYLSSQGATEDEMWNAALSANIIWFPDAYKTISEYMKEQGIDGKNISAQVILGPEYSSASGFANISARVKQPIQKQSNGGCDVGSGIPAQVLPKQKGVDCGL